MRAVARGVVQGVGFRYSARATAQRLKVGGYARNLPDGAVELEAEGESDAVEQFLAWARRGPAGARVGALGGEQGAAAGGRDLTIRR